MTGVGNVGLGLILAGGELKMRTMSPLSAFYVQTMIARYYKKYLAHPHEGELSVP